MTADWEPIRRAIADWYAAHGRHSLPWRKTHDPYRIYLSEIMLQQTQVKTVLERFWEPFLERFPTLRAVAESSEESVLHAWQGLGYYSRARNLYRTARQCATDGLPDIPEALQQLPGIGKNTAHAIAAFAYGCSVPVMEANVKRILCRLHALNQPSDAELWRLAFELLGEADPFTHNQAMMDIGALVCTKTDPSCKSCPLESACLGKHQPERHPQSGPKTYKKIVVHHLLIEHEGKLAVMQPKKGLYAGLWGFPCTEEEPEDPASFLASFPYAHTNKRLDVRVYQANQEVNEEALWVSPQELEKLPMGNLAKKVLAIYLQAKKR